MKNKLLPLTPCASTQGEYEPAGVPHGHRYRQLIPRGPGGSLVTRDDLQSFRLRPDLNGLVHHCGGLPIIEIDDGALFAVQNPDPSLTPAP